MEFKTSNETQACDLPQVLQEMKTETTDSIATL
jgi:hypothetical protein